MTIKQALKKKNKLVKQISEYYLRFSHNNSFEKGTTVPYDAKEYYDLWINAVNELIDLKTRIHKANIKVYDKIFRLAELKSVVKQLRGVHCDAGISGRRSPRRGYSMTETDPIEMIAIIGIHEKDNLIKKYEDEIEQLQEELDAHNAKTKI